LTGLPDAERLGRVRRLADAAGALGIIGALLLLAAPAESSRRTALGSTRDWAYALAIQRDGKLVAAGLSRQRSGSFALARYTGRGALDKRFGRGGKVLTRLGVYGAYGLAIQRDGKLVAGGYGGLVRYDPAGKLDPGFGRRGIEAGFDAFDVAVQNDGKIVAAGASRHHFALARFTVRGSLDPSFGQGGKVTTSFQLAAAVVAIQTDGKIVGAGSSYDRSLLARYTAHGKPDPNFGKGGKVVPAIAPLGLAIQPDGKLIVAGGDYVGGSEDFALARYNPDGRLDTSFGDGGKVLTDFTRNPNCSDCEKSNETANAVTLEPDGKIIAAGRSDANGSYDSMGHSSDDFALARYTSDGTLDQSFGRDGKVLTHFVGQQRKPSSSIAQAVVIQTDGKIVLAGLGNGYDFALARYTPSGRLDGSFGRGGKVLTDFTLG
jgi:uncharacterized delta-60 repeat protein